MDNKHSIILYLGKRREERFTMRELSQMLHIPYASFYRTVQQMTDLLVIKNIGKAKTLTLNIKNPIIKAHLTIAADEEKKEFLKKQPIIRKMANELDTKYIVVLFGSYAKGKANERSDIDILIINKDGRKDVSFSKYELLFKKKINPIFITKNEFKKMLQDKEENVGKQALKNHIVLSNPEAFWECALHAI